MQKNLKGADGIRAIACLMVIFHHIFKRLYDGGQALPINEIQFFSKTFSAGVSAFFVLSGFLLSYPFWNAYLDDKKLPSLRLYALKRAARIVPGYYVSLTFCFLMSLLLLPDAINSFGRYLSGLTFTSAFSWKTLFPSEFNGPLWSVGFEVICYFLLPFAMIGLFSISKKRHAFKGIFYWIGILSIILIINQFIQLFGQTDSVNKGWDFGLIGGAKVWWPNYNPIGFFAQYTFGVLAAVFTILISKSKFNFSSVWFDFAAITTLSLLIILLWKMRHESPFAFSFQSQPFYFPLFPIGISILLCVLPHSKFMGDLFDNNFLKFTALLSFGLYIWHNVVLEFIKQFWYPQYYHGGMKDLVSWFMISTLAIIFSYLIAGLSWKFIEKPIVTWASKKAEIIKAKYLRSRYFDSVHQKFPAQIKSSEQKSIGR